MTFFYLFTQGWRISWRYRRVTAILYSLLLAVALLIVLPVHTLLDRKAGHSLMIGDLVEGFDYTFLNDFKNAYGAALSPVFQYSILAMLIFLLFFTWLCGGILMTLKKFPAPFDNTTFWGNSTRFFWRLLRLSFYFLLMNAALLVLFGWIYLKITKGLSLAELEDDRLIISALLWLLPFYFFILVLLLCWQDYTRLFLLQTNSRWLYKPLRQALQFLKRYFLQVYGLYLAYWILLILLVVIQTLIAGYGGTLLTFLIIQVFIILRLGIRVANWSSAWTIVKHHQETK